MDIEQVRSFCVGLPHVTEDVKWGNDLCFCVGSKMFAVTVLEPTKVVCSFKCTPEKFAELIERQGIIPAPYLARYHWVALESFEALPGYNQKELLKKSFDLVYDKLPKKVKNAL